MKKASQICFLNDLLWRLQRRLNMRMGCGVLQSWKHDPEKADDGT